MGGLLVTTFLILTVTGVLLMTAYAPSPQAAWASVHYVSTSLAGGWLVRGLHHAASNVLLVLLAAHLVRVALAGGYKAPRELEWWLLLAAFGLVMALAISGGLLPWDQKGYWARRVELGILGMAPALGNTIQQLAQGGPQMGNLALTRAYALHVTVLPLLLGLTLWMQTRLARRHGYAPVLGSLPKGANEPYSEQLARNAVAGALLTAVLLYIAWRAHGAPLDAPADPASDYPARPEWYLMPLFQLRKYFHGPWEFYGTVLLPGLLGAYLALLPVLDKRVTFGARVPFLVPVVLAAVAAPALAILAVRHDARDREFQKAVAKADARADVARKIAMAGVPPEGPLAMLRNDPELRGEDLFAKSCASCHVLGDLGDKAKANAPMLDGWGTESWLTKMMHDPDAETFFGRTPYKGEMPPVDVASPDHPAMTDAEGVRAIAAFLARQGDEKGDPPHNATADETLKKGEQIVTDRCTTCHLFKGEGDDEGSGKAPELAGYGSIAWIRTQIANPSSKETYREGALDPEKKGHMPRFDNKLSAADIDILARWTRAKARGVPLVQP
jgi:ubiquinol-cytochrome c reductase cytochrome b subunit